MKIEEMFTMAKIRDGSTYLDRHLSANDYYAEHESVKGQWIGKASELLELKGEISTGDGGFESLRKNLHPVSREKLTPRNVANRVCFLDFQCSAPKSVSIMAMTLGDARLLQAHDQAVTKAFTELESFAATQTNTITHRSVRSTGNVVSARFRHTASRALDPQVHTHLVTANATWDAATKSWRALTEIEMIKAIRYAGKVYQNDLARACRELGYTISQVQDDRGRTTGFELTEVSIELRQRFSKRRADIEKGIVDFEIKNGRSPSTAEIHAITVKTRNAKLAEISTTEVISNQRAQLSAAELKELHRISSEAVRSVELSGAKRSVPRERESLGAAIGHTFERRSVVYGHELLAEALNQNIGFLDLDALKIQASKTGLVPLAEGNQLCQPFATERGLHQERWAVNLINLTKGSGEPLSKRPLEEASILSVSQRTAINSLLSCRDQFQSLRGAAGVGKTTLLKELDEHLRSEGHRMIYCAPTTSAADTLRKDGLADATTVSDFLTNGCLEESKKLQGAVLVVDEAGLSSNNQGVSLMRIAKQNGARILFVGDSKQHTSVEAGDFLRVLESHSSIQRIELSSIRRQTDKNYRKAIQLMATGATKQGLEYLDQMKSISDDGPDYISKAVETYLRKTNQGQNHSAAIAVTPTWAENRAFTEALRTELKARGCIKASKPVTVLEPLPWTRSQARQASNYRPGMILDCTKNSPGFERGARFQVLDIAGGKVRATDGKTEKNIPVGRIEATISVPREIEVGEGDKILIRANDRSAGLKNGEVLQVAALESGKLLATDGRSIDTRMFKYFDHGFAVTSHKSQSKTAEHVVVAAAALDAKSTYVACSRGRRSCTLHTPDKEQLFDRLPEGNREAALDVLGKALPRPPHTNPPQDQSHKIEATQRAWGWWRRNLGRWFVGRESSESEHDRESRV